MKIEPTAEPTGHKSKVLPGAVRAREKQRFGQAHLIRAALPYLGCFSVATLVYVWFGIDTSLQFHALDPVFLFGRRFFQEHLTYPGGLLQYAAAFVLQFYRLSWAGALITFSLTVGLYVVSSALLGCARVPAKLSVSLCVPALFIASQADYHFMWMEPAIALLLALAFAAAYASLPSERPLLRSAIYALCSVLAYFVLCGFYLLSAWLCALLMLRRKRFLEAVFCLVLAAAIPYLAVRFVFIISLLDGYGLLLPFFSAQPVTLGAKALICFCAGMIPVLFGLQWLAARSTQFFIWHPALWAAMSGLGILLSHDPQSKLIAQIDYYTQNQEWSQALEAGKKLRRVNPTAILDINRSLAHTTKLLDEMFAYPQKRGLDLWLDVNSSVDLNHIMNASDLLLELGHVNRAQRMAGEALEMTGYRPATLERLFLISVLKDESDSGMPFLNLLSKTFWGKAKAEQYWQALRSDPELRQNKQLQQVRSIMVSKDYVGTLPPNVVLQISLRQSPSNRMAFDYLIAHYLLENNLEKAVQNLDRLDALGLKTLPRHLEEAILLYQQVHTNTAVDLRGRTLSAATTARHQQLTRDMAQFLANPALGEAPLQPLYGDTFWYYYIYGHSGSLLNASRK